MHRRDQQKRQQADGQRDDAGGEIDQLQARRVRRMWSSMYPSLSTQRRVDGRRRRAGGDGRHGSIIGGDGQVETLPDRYRSLIGVGWPRFETLGDGRICLPIRL